MTGATERSRVGAFARDATVLTASQYVAAAAGFATSVVAARWLGASSFGLAAVIMAYPTAVATIVSVKSGTVTLRYLPGMRDAGDRAGFLALAKLGFLLDGGASLLGSAVIAATAFVAGGLPGTDGHAGVIALYAASLPLATFGGTGLAVFSSYRRFGLASALQVADKAIVLVAVVVALLIDATPTGLVLGTAVGQAGAGVVWITCLSIFLARRGGWWWTADLSRVGYLWKELRALFGWNFVGVTLSGAVSQLPIILLGSAGSATDAAYFRLASAVAVVADYPEIALGRVAWPIAGASVASARDDELSALHQRWLRREGMLAGGLVIIAMILLPFVVRLFFGVSFEGMVLGTEYMLFGIAVSSMFFFLVPYLYSAGRVKTWVVAYGVYAAVVVGLGFVMASLFGFSALAAVVGFGLAALNLVLGVAVLTGRSWVRARRLPT